MGDAFYHWTGSRRQFLAIDFLIDKSYICCIPVRYKLVVSVYSSMLMGAMSAQLRSHWVGIRDVSNSIIICQ